MNYDLKHNEDYVILLKNTYELWKNIFNKFSIIYLQAFSGYGKTVNVIQFAKENYKKWEYYSCKDNDFINKVSSVLNMEVDKRCNQLIIIDDLELLSNEQDTHDLLEILISILHKKHKISIMILSRAELPEYLEPFYITKQLEIRYKSDIIFDKPEIEDLFMLHKLELIPYQIDLCYKITKGYPIGIMLFINMIKESDNEESIIVEAIKRSIFQYFDLKIFSRLDGRIQKILVQMARFKEFNVEMIHKIACNERGKELIRIIINKDSFLLILGKGKYTINPVFREFLMEKEEIIFTEEQRKIFYYRAAIYYEKNEEFMLALEYYSMAKDFDKVVEILKYILNNYGGSAYFKDTYMFYEKIPEKILLESPELLAAMSMLYSIRMQEDKSQYYFKKLKELIEKMDKNDYRMEKALEKNIYLNIALPHKGIKDIVKIICTSANICVRKKIELQMVSVTSNLPSLMNGGKDFCMWSRHDRLLYKLIAKPISQVLGRNAIGLTDVGLGESLYEKDNRIEAITYLTKGLSEASLNEQLQIEFAAVGIMSKLFLADGNMDTAEGILNNLKSKLKKNNHREFLINVNANIINLELRKGNDKIITYWCDKKAPDEFGEFFITDRYQYMIKIRVYIYKEKYTEALSLIERMKVYSDKYNRRYLSMELGLLQAIILFRIGGNYKEIFLNTLKKIESYKFIRIVADEGIAIYSLWKQIDFDNININISKEYLKKVEQALKDQAELYPKYLQPQVDPERLSKYELEVLRLLAEGLNNEQIAKELNVSRANVKYYASNMYKKLKVNNRAMAVKVANERNIL
ncbi:MAG: hypothetical protein GX275_02325 [Clostridiales bacterium]|nr:hypothetical protein [Clostridiales bacterium]